MIDLSLEYQESVKERIMNNIEVNKNSCWIWSGCKQKLGYGIIGTCQNYKHKTNLVHRVSFYLWKEDPKNKLVLHKCGQRSCCNPDHLYLGNQKDNMRDRVNDGNFSNGDRKGEKHPMCKLNEKTVKNMREDYLQGKTPKEISSKYCINRNYLYDILNRKCWKHI